MNIKLKEIFPNPSPARDLTVRTDDKLVSPCGDTYYIVRISREHLLLVSAKNGRTWNYDRKADVSSDLRSRTLDKNQVLALTGTLEGWSVSKDA